MHFLKSALNLVHFLEEHQSDAFKEDMIKEGIEDQNDDSNIDEP